jgi:hypothetical protein
MTNEEYIEIKKDYMEHINEVITNHGELFPHITIFADQLHPDEANEGKPAVIHIIIPDEFMENEDTKDKFVYQMMPDIFKDLKKDFKPHGIAWAAEAWMRVAIKGEYVPGSEEYKNLPKKEVVIISISTTDEDETIIYEMIRKGKQINSHGTLTDIVVLEKMPEVGNSKNAVGRFTNLFKKFDKN